MLDGDDKYHQRCVMTAGELPVVQLLTTWPCFTEAMYLLHGVGGYRYQTKLWELYQSNQLAIHDLTDTEIMRMIELMHKYQDTPMDMADASLVAVAENLSFTQIFSLDSHFYIYRLNDGSVLEVIP